MGRGKKIFFSLVLCGGGCSYAAYRHYMYPPSLKIEYDGPANFPGGNISTFLENTDNMFKQWLTYQSKTLRLKIGTREDGLRGVFAAYPIKEGKCVFRISRKYILGKDEIVKNEWVQKSIWAHGKFLNSWDQNWDACTTSLILALIYHTRLGEESFWHPFCSTLPTKVDGVKVQNIARKTFDYLKRRDVVEDLTWEEYYWAYCMVHTRSFQTQGKLTRMKMDLKRKMGLEYDPFHGCFFPLGDLVNHSDHPSVHPKAVGIHCYSRY